jgi:hypothetical protein
MQQADGHLNATHNAATDGRSLPWANLATTKWIRTHVGDLPQPNSMDADIWHRPRNCLVQHQTLQDADSRNQPRCATDVITRAPAICDGSRQGFEHAVRDYCDPGPM